MTQVWDDDNNVVPVTVLRVQPVRVVQVKTTENDGYSALQVTYGQRDARKLTKPVAGHYDKAGVDPGVKLVELRLDDVSDYAVGQELAADLLEAGPAGRRHRRVQGQGLRRRHEAAQLQGPGRLARQPQESPRSRRRSASAPRQPGSSRA